MINVILEDKIRALASIAKPTPTEYVTLMDGWDRYFTIMNIDTNDQETEFDAIVRARIYSGIISIVAPSK